MDFKMPCYNVTMLCDSLSSFLSENQILYKVVSHKQISSPGHAVKNLKVKSQAIIIWS